MDLDQHARRRTRSLTVGRLRGHLVEKQRGNIGLKQSCKIRQVGSASIRGSLEEKKGSGLPAPTDSR